MSSNSQFQFIKCCIVPSNECSYKSYTSELYSPRIINIDIPMINYQNAWYFFFYNYKHVYGSSFFKQWCCTYCLNLFCKTSQQSISRSPISSYSLSVLRNWVVYLYHKMSQKLSTLYFAMVIKWRDIFRWER